MELVGSSAEERLDAVFSALADPTRRAILRRLAAGDATVAEIAQPFAMSQPAVSKHLRVLEHAGLISRSRVATARYSHLEAQPLKEAAEWVERYRRFWSDRLDRLDDALAAFVSAHEQPTGPTEEHTDQPEQHADEPEQHAGESDQPSGQPDRVTDQREQPTDPLDEHAGEPRHPAGRHEQPAEQPEEHA